MDKVISFGEALVDMLSTHIEGKSSNLPEAFIKFPGGAPANVAAAIGKLGGRSYFAGKIGQDMFGEFMNESLQQAQVNTDYLLFTDKAKTALAFVSLDETGERSFEFYRNPSADLLFTANEFEQEWFNEPGIFHFCSNTLTEPGIQNATYQGIQKARDAGFIVSFDVNLRLNLWPEGIDPFEAIWHCASSCDIIKLCIEELNFLCQNRNEEKVIQEILQSGCSLVLVTNGGGNLRYYTANRTGTISPPKVTMVDSTAAGDAFVGGFLYALAEKSITKRGISLLTSDIDVLESAITFACACGAHAVTHKGAFTSLPTKADLALI